jgi:hypothetical protein
MHFRSDYDFDVISGPSTRPLPPPAPPPRPAGGATPAAEPRPADGMEGGGARG